MAYYFAIITTAKRNNIIYWIATVWFSLGMVASGILQLIQQKDEVVFMAALGYPAYFLSIIGAWKLLGVIAVLAPKYPLVKEWAYAGFFLTMTGAFFSHIGSGDTFGEMFPAIFLTALIVISWYFRPESRRLAGVPGIAQK